MTSAMLLPTRYGYPPKIVQATAGPYMVGYVVRSVVRSWPYAVPGCPAYYLWRPRRQAVQSAGVAAGRGGALS